MINSNNAAKNVPKRLAHLVCMIKVRGPMPVLLKRSETNLTGTLSRLDARHCAARVLGRLPMGR